MYANVMALNEMIMISSDQVNHEPSRSDRLMSHCHDAQEVAQLLSKNAF
ncbi:hypothetical protein C4K04_6319 [Pseudomonas chlororaphis]|uniref:Uncharacterized protein n=1 Tax=Pseudomonas chlororaphis TaxID=587753 RepID=A0A3G7TXX2_9PSED|nr:hypothetical protein C4K04_6319 [Pseudomonas chlororaphis]